MVRIVASAASFHLKLVFRTVLNRCDFSSSKYVKRMDDINEKNKLILIFLFFKTHLKLKWWRWNSKSFWSFHFTHSNLITVIEQFEVHLHEQQTEGALKC